MRMYWEFIKTTFQMSMAYKADVYFSILKTILILVIQISIWKTLFNSVVNISIQNGIVNMTDMITYSIISTCISIIVGNNIISTFNNKVRTGEVVMDLIKPINFKYYLFSQSIGSSLFRVVTILLPFLAVSFLVYRFYCPTIIGFLVFVAAVFNALLILFLLSYIIGITAFWYFEIWHFERLLGDIIQVMSGSLIPLWLFPKALVSLSDYLPFKYIYYAPITIWLGKIGLMQSVTVILKQYLWIIILILIEKILWKKAVKKLVIQGG